MTTKIQLRRDTSANWTSTNPTLFSGEIGFETNTGKFKIGNGSTVWSSLDYFLDSSDLSGYLTAASASTTYLTQASASTSYLTQASASTTYLTQVSASTTYSTISSPTFTGIVNIPSGVVTTSSNAGYMGIPQNNETTGSYTVNESDNGKHIHTTTTRTITIPSNATTALPIGFTTTFTAASGATVTIQVTADTMYLAGVGTTGSRTLGQFGMATAIKTGTTSWIISGNGLT